MDLDEELSAMAVESCHVAAWAAVAEPQIAALAMADVEAILVFRAEALSLRAALRVVRQLTSSH